MQETMEQLIRDLLHAGIRIEEELLQESGMSDLTTKQLNCIEAIWDLANPTLSELALKMQTTRPSVSVMLSRLEEHGYIRRVVSDKDRRSAHIHLRSKGERAARIHLEAHRKIHDQLIMHLTDSEKEILRVLLNKSMDSLQKEKRSRQA